MAADIESLIRQALARQNGFDPEVRTRIYQSSRNALAKMIAKRGMVPPDVIESRNKSLEETIDRIEQEFTATMPADLDFAADPSFNNAPIELPQTAPNPSPVSIPQSLDPSENLAPEAHFDEFDTGHIPEPNFDPNFSSANAPTSPQFEQPTQVQREGVQHDQLFTSNPASVDTPPTPMHFDDGDPHQYAAPTPKLARPRKKVITYIIWLIALALIVLIGWIAYAITTEFLAATSSNPKPAARAQNTTGNASGKFVTILDPSQPDALVTAGHGTAEILSDITQPAIRITSVRSGTKLGTQAEPMLLKLAPGILKNISGRKVTVEILAKSGGTGAATFSVTCNFGDLGECGRKRFRIGLQPEAVIFSILISPNYKDGQTASLAINTDVTSAAAQTGKGAAIDIIYARIRN